MNAPPPCGGCRDLGAHVRWCPAVVGPIASRLGPLAEESEALGDQFGATDPAAANHAYIVARVLRTVAQDTANRWKARP